MTLAARALALAGALAAGCAAVPARVRPPRAAVAPAVRWQSPLLRDHPLVGRIWDAAHARFVDEPALLDDLAHARFVLLGEVHDNADHHALQARVVRALRAAGRRPALAFEMLEVEQQAAVDQALAAAPGDPDAVARAVDWAHSGWPEWALYRPVFAAGVEAGLRIVAANFPRRGARALVMQGADGVDAATRARLGLDQSLPAAVEEAMREELRASHCGHLPEAMAPGMVLAQRARDAEMAERLLAAAGPEGAVLVAGAGHARVDRGVPARLRARAPEATVRVVALLEVEQGRDDPRGYAARFDTPSLPFDYAWFTPRAARDPDPCARFRLPPTR